MEVFTIGEVVLDIVIDKLDSAKVRVGGSMLNTAISLGRLGIDISHISYLAKGSASGLIVDFLEENNVNSNNITFFDGVRPNLALAILDCDRNADYTFYKDELERSIEMNYPKIEQGDIVLFGSLFSLNRIFRKGLISFLRYARSNGAFIIYDPNFRKSYLNKLNEYMPYVEENLSLSHMVKGSNEDFNLIFGFNTKYEVFERVKKYDVEYLVYTKGEYGVGYLSESFDYDLNSDRVHALSTIGAGDTFSAGIIYSYVLNENKIISEEFVINMLKTSVSFSAEVCKSYDNYLSADYIKRFKNV